jgi:eukaryotic-like serine/threonine-protein kinase
MSSRSTRDTSSKRGRPPVMLDAGLATYELVRSLGQDHHGELLLTRQRYRQGLGGYTVLKRLNRVTRQEDYQRLVEEARLGSQFHHPNIAAVQSLQGTEDEPFLLMEYVEGQPLGDLMRLVERRGRSLSEAFACHVTAEVADGLHYVHALTDERGRHLEIVHRDVTPQGILIGRYGEVKLTDFGAAWSRLTGRKSTEGDSDLGQGSLAYGSPERVVGDPLDGRSDLFSLGLILLELRTGRHLFDATARHRAELRGRHLLARGVLPARVSGLKELSVARAEALMRRIGSLTPQQVEEATRALPEGLRSILHRTLAPRREDRYSTGGELAQALREYLWASGQRYGRAELVAEVSALHGKAPGPREDTPTDSSGKRLGVSRRRQGAGRKKPRDLAWGPGSC